MAWVTRNGHRYYYRSKRIDGKVVRIYCGTGEAAELAAMEDETRRQQKREAKEFEQQCTQTLIYLQETLRRQESLLSSLGFHYPQRGPLRKMNARTLKRKRAEATKTRSDASTTKTPSKKTSKSSASTPSPAASTAPSES